MIQTGVGPPHQLSSCCPGGTDREAALAAAAAAPGRLKARGQGLEQLSATRACVSETIMMFCRFKQIHTVSEGGSQRALQAKMADQD